MKFLVAAALVGTFALSASEAEARARFKLRSVSTPTATTPAKPATAPSRPEGGGVLPAVAIGAGLAVRPARARSGGEDIATGSAPDRPGTLFYTPRPTSAAAAPASATGPAFVCASDRRVGGGFCELN